VRLCLIKYLYPAAIFEARVNGGLGSLTVDLPLKSTLFESDLPENLNPENIRSIQPTVKGYLIMFICLFGVPLMLAYRSTLKRSDQNSETKN